MRDQEDVAAAHHYVVLPDYEPDMEVQLPSGQYKRHHEQRRNSVLAAITFAAVFGLGLALGLTLPDSKHMPAVAGRISSVLGWTYFWSWSISFYPQLFINWRRRSVEGLSFDFLAANFCGFICYTVFNCAMFWSTKVRCEYSGCTGSDVRAVDLNDVVFSVHAVAITGLTILQCFMYERGGQRLSRFTALLIVLLVLGLGGLAAGVAVFGEQTPLTWLTVVYVFSFVKMGITIVKYIPQVVLNCQRRSTVGWSIMNVLLDINGGLLSMAQQLLKAGMLHDWSVVFGNPVKLGLALCSLGFDSIFIVQHYFLYPEAQHALPTYSKMPADAPPDGGAVFVEASGSPQIADALGSPQRSSRGQQALSEEDAPLLPSALRQLGKYQLPVLTAERLGAAAAGAAKAAARSQQSMDQQQAFTREHQYGCF